MVARLIEWCVKDRLWVLLLTFFLVVGGIWCHLAGGEVGNPAIGPAQAGPGTRPSRPASRPTSVAASQPSSQPALPKSTELVNEIVRAYLKSYEALTRDDLAAAKEPMPTIMQSGNALHDERPGLAPLLSAIGTMAAQANDSRDLAAFRAAFGQLSPPVIQLAKVIPPTRAAAPSLYAAHCPMLKKDWLQAGKPIDNPYDRSMRACGTLRSDDLVREVPREQ